MRLISTAGSGVRAQQLQLDTLADNLANVNTTGFKARHIDFAETLAVSQQPTGNDGRLLKREGTLDVGAGVMYRGTPLNMQQGKYINTENPLDIAINGEGFFSIEKPNGQRAYTRAGNFKVDYSSGKNNGRLVDLQGNSLNILSQQDIPENTELSISEDGKITGIDANGQKREFGQIILVNFANPSALANIGDNLFTQTDQSGEEITLLPGQEGTAGIKSHMLEMSNVDLAKEMSELIQAQRAYQVNIRMIQNGDRMWELANALRR